MRLRRAPAALAVQVEPEAPHTSGGTGVTEQVTALVPESPHPKRKRRLNPLEWIGRTGIGVWVGLLFASG